MHPSRLRLGPSQSRPLTDASPGSARSPGLRVRRAAPSRRRNIHTHAPFRTECPSFLRCRDMRLTISRKRGAATPCSAQGAPFKDWMAADSPWTAEVCGSQVASASLCLQCDGGHGVPVACFRTGFAPISSHKAPQLRPAHQLGSRLFIRCGGHGATCRRVHRPPARRSSACWESSPAHTVERT